VIVKRLVLLWIVSLVVVAMATFAFAQGRLAQPQMLSGNDIGFRVESIDLGGKAVGTWMVRYNGNWIEVGSTGGLRPATK
jgi:hypothetical protein